MPNSIDLRKSYFLTGEQGLGTGSGLSQEADVTA